MYRVAVGSPSDVFDERTAAREAIYAWNDHNARANRSVLLPVLWETHATPELGDHPQILIESRVLRDCQILIAIFWSRLGSPTPNAPSGTVSEIERFLQGGKPVLVYFCSRPLPQDFDLVQWQNLQAFKNSLKDRGLIDQFTSAEELESKLRQHLTSTLQRLV